jgi:hypothetical protein
MMPAPAREADLDQLLEILNALTELMRQENAFLRSGMPAALSELGDGKEKLTQRLMELSRMAGVPGATDQAEEQALKRHLAASGDALKALTRENMQLLEGAMSASRRRIESVMQAIRAHEGMTNGGAKAALDFRISTVKFEI